MAILKTTLGKDDNNGNVTYIYPKTSADIVEYDDDISVKDRLDALSSIAGLSLPGGGFIDSDVYVKPILIEELERRAVQSIAYIGTNSDGDQFCLVGFSKDDQDDESASYIEIVNITKKQVAARKDCNFYHMSSIARDSNGIFYVMINDNEDFFRHIKKFSIDRQGENITIHDRGMYQLQDNLRAWTVFDYNGRVYIYGYRENEARTAYWALDDPDTYTYIDLPYERPRTEQTFSTDGTYLYWLNSNPNTIGLFNFATGKFLRYINVGDFVGDTCLIGEIEMLCFVNGEAKMCSQYYYPSADKSKRFWMLSTVKFSKDIPAKQEHWYPNEDRPIYVSNAAKSVATVTNFGNRAGYNKGNLLGTANNPFISFETAFYAAMATPNSPANIILMDTGIEYNIEDFILRVPHMTVNISCQGKTKFGFVHVVAGKLFINGSAIPSKKTTISRVSTTNRATFGANNCIFDGIITFQSNYNKPKALKDNASDEEQAEYNEEIDEYYLSIEDADNYSQVVKNGNFFIGDEYNDIDSINKAYLDAINGCDSINRNIERVIPYQFGGIVSITNGEYYGQNVNTIIDLKAGTTGVIGFTNGTYPRSNRYQQLNVVEYGVINGGARDAWLKIYDDPTLQNKIAIGYYNSAALKLNSSTNILPGNRYRITWKAASGVKCTTLVSIPNKLDDDDRNVITAELSYTREAYKTYIKVINGKNVIMSGRLITIITNGMKVSIDDGEAQTLSEIVVDPISQSIEIPVEVEITSDKIVIPQNNDNINKVIKINNREINNAESINVDYIRSIDKYINEITEEEILSEIEYLYSTGRIDRDTYNTNIVEGKVTNYKNRIKMRLAIRKADDNLIFDKISYNGTDENKTKTNIVAGYQLYTQKSEIPTDSITGETWAGLNVGDRIETGLYKYTMNNSSGTPTEYEVRKYAYGEVIVSHIVKIVAHIEFRPATETSPATIVIPDLKLFKTDVETGKTEVRCYTHIAPPPEEGSYTIDDFPIEEVGNPIIAGVLVRTAPVVATSFGIYSIELAV